MSITTICLLAAILFFTIKTKKQMSDFATQLAAKQAETQATVTRIAEDVQTLLGKVADAPTEEEKAQLISQANTTLEALKNLDAQVPNVGDEPAA